MDVARRRLLSLSEHGRRPDRQTLSHSSQAPIQGVGAGARAHPWEGVSPFKMLYSIAFKHQSIIGRPPLGEILYPPLPPTQGRSREEAPPERSG